MNQMDKKFSWGVDTWYVYNKSHDQRLLHLDTYTHGER